MGGLIAQNPSLTMQNTMAVNGLKYEPDLQAGFFKEEKRLNNNSNSMWYAKAKIRSSEGWAGFASLYLRTDAPNNPNRLKLLIPIARNAQYIGLGAIYGSKTIDFFITFDGNNNDAIVYFRFNGSVTSAYLRCSSYSSFDIVDEPSGVTWIAAVGNLSNF